MKDLLLYDLQQPKEKQQTVILPWMTQSLGNVDQISIKCCYLVLGPFQQSLLFFTSLLISTPILVNATSLPNIPIQTCSHFSMPSLVLSQNTLNYKISACSSSISENLPRKKDKYCKKSNRKCPRQSSNCYETFAYFII